MAATDPWPARVLGPGDLGRAMELSAGAGWNQVNADWRVFLELGHLVGVDVTGDGVVGTAATLPLGHDFGWISMMLVAPTFRRRGIGRQLLGACVLDLAAQGLIPGLDATPAGRELYREFDFRDGWALTRWRCAGAQVAPAEAADEGKLEIRAATAGDLDAIAGLDRWAFGCERRSVLARLIERAPRLATVAVGGGVLCGFLLAREGREAFQIGPIVATEAGVATALLARAVTSLASGACIDLLDRHQEVGAWLAARGFAPERRLTRMLFRRDEPFGDARLAFAIAGPELG